MTQEALDLIDDDKVFAVPEPVVRPPLHLGRRLWSAFKDWRGAIILGVALAVVILI